MAALGAVICATVADVGSCVTEEERIVAGPGIAEVLAEVALEAEAAPDLERTLQRVVRGAADTVRGADAAGMSLIDRGSIRTVAATDDVADRVDRLQHELREGPCLAALEDQATYSSGDLLSDGRWPRFGPAAALAGSVR